jgi:hypothetical protein
MNKLGTFFSLLKYFWSHGDQVYAFFTLMLEQLPVIGKSLENAGEIAITTGKALNSPGTVPPGAAQIVEGAADAIDICSEKIGDIAEKIDAMNDIMHDINIPSITIENKDYPVLGGLGKVTVPTLEATNWYPFRDIEDNIDDQSEFFNDTSSQLEGTGEDLHELNNFLVKASQNFKDLGKELKAAGKLLKELAPD